VRLLLYTYFEPTIKGMAQLYHESQESTVEFIRQGHVLHQYNVDIVSENSAPLNCTTLISSQDIMAFTSIRRALGRRVDFQLPVVGFGGAGIMLGGKEPVTDRAGIGESHGMVVALSEWCIGPHVNTLQRD
jgi:hypothetical protein